jgi:hypothetical protein
MTILVEFQKGLPDHGDPCIFLLWDGSLCEGFLSKEGERRMLTTYSLAGPAPERITMRADGGKIQGFAELRGHQKAE